MTDVPHREMCYFYENRNDYKMIMMSENTVKTQQLVPVFRVLEIIFNSNQSSLTCNIIC